MANKDSLPDQSAFSRGWDDTKKCLGHWLFWGAEAFVGGAIVLIAGGVLRAYAGLRYGDSSSNDWYAFYLKVAQLNSNHWFNLLEKGKEESWRVVMDKPMRQLMEETREKMLVYPPRTPVEEPANVPDA